MRASRMMSCIVAVPLWIAGVCAQTTTFPAGEAEAFRLKSRGEYRAAMNAFVGLLESAQDDERSAAHAEFHATVAQLLASRLGDLGFRARLREFAAGPVAERHPSLRDRCLHLALDLARMAGDHGGVADLTKQLGYLTRWTIIGPFDNERGGGFDRRFGPEVGLDLDASYDGKKRAVRWRDCPVSNPAGGRINLNAMLRPNDQVLAYAIVALRADVDTDAILHLGSDEAAKVFLNGAEVWKRDVRRRFAPDQDGVALRLRAGWNRLMIKVCDQEGAFEFAARLRAIDGSLLTGVVESASREDLIASASVKPAPEQPTMPKRGAYAVLQRSVDETGDATDAVRLGLLLALNHGDDDTARRDHELAKQAVAAMPNSATARYLLAFTRVRSGRSEERDENARRRDYEAILAEHAEHAEAMRSLAELELDDVGNAGRAVELLERALTINPEFRAAEVALARALASLDMRVVADRHLANAAGAGADGLASPEAIARLFDRLETQRAWHRAARLGPARLESAFDSPTAVSVADVALRTGDDETAMRVLRRAATHLPFSRAPRRRLAGLHEARREYDAALAALGDWLRVCPEDDEVLVDVARIHGLRGDTEQQRETLRTAVELNPNRKNERRHLEYLLADEVPFYDAFAIELDADLRDASLVPDDAVAANDPHFYLLQHDVVRAYRNGTTSRYHHEVLRILNDQGARDLTTFYVPHFWGEQRARLLSVRIVKADGQELRPRLSGSYVRFPPLAPGDTCEIRYRVDDLAPSFFGDYFGLVHPFAANDGTPVRRSVLDVILEPGRDYRIQSRNGAPEAQPRTAEDGTTIHHFEMRDLARRKPEELRPKLAETEPLVRITTYRDWDHFSSWWYNLIRKQSEMTPTMREKVAELTKGLDDEVAKIDAIYRFVTTDINYKAWEFGVHGYKPYSTPVIFERRHGDCKDKALLMNVMLDAVGIEAYPVLIYADPQRSTDDLSLPMVEHFNHCISYLPATESRGAMFLDGTATYHPLDTLPDMDQGAKVLVVRGEDGKLRDIDWIRAEQNLDAREFDVQLEPDGAATITMTHRPKRNQAVWVRDRLGNEPAKRRERIERQLTGLFGSVEILSVDTSDLLDLNVPVEVTVKFRCPEFASRQDGGLVLKPTLLDRSLQGLTSAKERDFALVLGVPGETAEQVTYRLPEGFEVTSIPDGVASDTRFGSFRSTWQADGGTLRLERRQALKTNRIEPQEYPDFREFAAEIDRADLRVVLIKKGER